MGYTHYWMVDRGADRGRLIEAGREMAKVVRASSVPLADGTGEGGTEPEIDLAAGTVWFNGVDDDSYEFFYWPPDLSRPDSSNPSRTFDFCKTSRMPYDHVVVACLLVAQRVLDQQIEIRSDGTLADFLDQTTAWDVEEESARSLYTRVFQQAPEIPPSFTPRGT
jgi:hypothetical protein